MFEVAGGILIAAFVLGLLYVIADDVSQPPAYPPKTPAPAMKRADKISYFVAFVVLPAAALGYYWLVAHGYASR